MMKNTPRSILEVMDCLLELPRFVVILAFTAVVIPASLYGLASLIYEQRFDEAATQYLLAAILVAAIGFVAWVRRDAIQSSERFEKQRRKHLAMQRTGPALDDGQSAGASRTPRPADDRIRIREISWKPATPRPASLPIAPDPGSPPRRSF